MRIFIDADSFPSILKGIVIKNAERLKIQVVVVANKFVRFPDSQFVKNIFAAEGPDAGDDYIAGEITERELVITSDIPLAGRAVDKGAYALNPRGELYDKRNITSKLAVRNLMDELRSNGIMTGGPSQYSSKNTQAFADGFTKLLDKIIREDKIEKNKMKNYE